MSAKTSPLITTDHPATPRRNGRCSRREFLRSAALGLTAFAAAPLLCGHAAHAATTGGKPMLIVYFSHSGNTRRLAACIQRLTGGDMAQITPLTPYPREYDAVVEMAKQEQRRNVRPPIAPLQPDPAAYDTLFIGYPNWWGDLPHAGSDLSGKLPGGEQDAHPLLHARGQPPGQERAGSSAFLPAGPPAERF